jgi:RNA polymerase sigma-70 factor (ECF subfamily)
MSRDVDRAFTGMLVLMAQQGEPEALERLAARWRPRHYAHARRLLGRPDGAADAVQEAWIGIVRGLAGLREPERFPSWSYAIVTRRCQDAIRRRMREPPGDPDFDSPDPATAGGEQAADLRRAVAALPADQRAAIALFYLDGLSVGEIAEALGIPGGTVKTRLFHARRALRRHLEGDEP